MTCPVVFYQLRLTRFGHAVIPISYYYDAEHVHARLRWRTAASPSEMDSLFYFLHNDLTPVLARDGSADDAEPRDICVYLALSQRDCTPDSLLALEDILHNFTAPHRASSRPVFVLLFPDVPSLRLSRRMDTSTTLRIGLDVTDIVMKYPDFMDHVLYQMQQSEADCAVLYFSTRSHYCSTCCPQVLLHNLALIRQQLDLFNLEGRQNVLDDCVTWIRLVCDGNQSSTFGYRHLVDRILY